MHLARSLSSPCLLSLALIGSIFVGLASSRVESQGSMASDKLRFADGLYEQGLFKLAIREYRDFEGEFSGHPQISAVRLRLGDSYLQEEQYDEAIGVLTRLLQQDPQFDRRFDAVYRLGRSFVEKGRFQEAIRALDAARKSIPPAQKEESVSQLIAYWLGEAYSRSNQPEKALNVLEQLLAGRVDEELVRYVEYAAGWSAYQAKSFAKAVEHFKVVVEVDDQAQTRAECLYMAGECLFELKKYAEALAEYSKATQVEGPYQDDAAFARGWCLFESGQFARAGEAFAALLERFPDSSFASKARLRAGISFFQADRDSEARSLLLQAANDKDLEVGPEAHYWLSMVLLRQNEVSEAIQFLSRVRTTDEKLSVRVGVALGEALYRQKRYKESVRAFARLTSQVEGANSESVSALGTESDSYAYALHASALSHQAMGGVEEALAAENKLLELFPKCSYVASALLVRGEALFALDQFGAAAESLARLIRDFPRDQQVPAALYKQGWSYFEQEKFGEARTSFTTLTSRYPKCEYAEESAKLAGQCLARLGKTSNAIDELQRVSSVEGEVGDHALLEVARLKREGDDLGGAAQAYAELVTKTEDGSLRARAHYEQGEVLYQGGAFDRATTAYLSAFEEAEDDTLKRAALYGVSWAYYRNGDFDRAVAFGTQLLSMEGIEPSLRASALHLRGAAHQKKGEWEPAISSFRTLLRDHPKSDVAYEAAFGLGVCFAGSGNSKDAVRSLQEVLKQYPEGSANDRVLYELAFAHEAEKQTRGMAQAFAKLLADYPKSPLVPEVRFRLGELQYEGGDFGAAAASYASVLEDRKSPYYDKSLYKKAWAERKNDVLEEAAKTFLKLAEDCPKSALRGEALYLAGDCLRKLSRPKQAASAYKRLLGDYAKHALSEKAHLDLGLCQYESKSFPESIQTLTRHRELYPKSERFFEVDFYLGKSLAELERYPSAIQAFRRVTSSYRGETAARSQFEIGECLRKQKNPEAAVSEYLKVRFLYGHPEWVAASMYRCAQCFEQLDQRDRAIKTYTELAEKFPEGEWASPSKERLTKLGEM